MRRYRTLLIVISGVLIVSGLLLWAVTHFAQPAQQDNPDVRTQPLFAARYADTQGVPQALQQWRGQVLVVNFWASWCPPCRDEMPELSSLQDRYHDRGVVVLGISTDDVAKMQEYAREAPVTYPLLAGGDAALDLAIQLGNDRQALPYTLILRRDGSVAASHTGRISLPAVENALTPLL